MSHESRRYETVDNFRVEAVERAFLFKQEPLLRSVPPWKRDEGFRYSEASLPKDKHGKRAKFASVDEAIEATRRVLSG